MKPVVGLLLGAALACSGVTETARQVTAVATDVASEVAGPGLDCEAPRSTAAPVGCLSGEIRCGQTIEATTEGADARWDDSFYRKKMCFAKGDDHSGPERVYLLRLPEYTRAELKLESNCADLDLVAMAWQYEGTCPDMEHSVNECDADIDRGGGRMIVDVFQNARTYLVAVDGKAAATGAFRLTVECADIKRR